MKKPEISIVLLAAGGSSRMRGVDKLLEIIDGISLLRRSAIVCCRSNATTVRVVLRAPDPLRRRELVGLPVTVIENPRAAQGMASSIVSGISGLPDSCDAVLVMLADMPDIEPRDLDRLIAGFSPQTGKTICRATSQDGRAGHPVLFGRCHFAALATLTGDAGGRDILRANPGAVLFVKTTGQAALTDLDTPADWAAYRGSD